MTWLEQSNALHITVSELHLVECQRLPVPPTPPLLVSLIYYNAIQGPLSRDSLWPFVSLCAVLCVFIDLMFMFVALLSF